MKFIKFDYYYDFGHDWYVQILNFGRHYPKFIKNISLIKFYIGWSESPSNPYLQIICGQGKLFSFLFSIYKFTVSLDIIGHTWKFNLYKGGEYYGDV